MATDPIFPLQISPDARRLLRSDDDPFFVHGDAAWSLLVELSYADACGYLDARAASGVTAVLVNLVEHYYSTHTPAWRNADGDLPFAGDPFTSALDSAYWAHAAAVIQYAATLGIAVIATPAYLGYPSTDEGWDTEVATAGTSGMTTYGTAVGTWGAGLSNLIWSVGGDREPDTLLDECQAMMTAIAAAGANQLVLAHSLEETSGIDEYPGCGVDVETVYSYAGTGTQMVAAWAHSGPVPWLYLEGDYEGSGTWTRARGRAQNWWAWLSGGNGHVYGNEAVWVFATGWAAALDSVGFGDFERLRAVLLSRDWATLTPDTTHAVLTSGYGSPADATYAPCAITGGGTTAVVYTPSAGTLAIDMGEIAGSTALCWWYSPGIGLALPIGEFACSGSRNFVAPTERVLVIDDASESLPSPGVALPLAGTWVHYVDVRYAFDDADPVTSLAPTEGTGSWTKGGAGSYAYDADGFAGEGAIVSTGVAGFTAPAAVNAVQPCGPWTIAFRIKLTDHGTSESYGDFWWASWGGGSYYIYIGWSKDGANNKLFIGGEAAGMSYVEKVLIPSAGLQGDEIILIVAVTAALGAVSVWLDGAKVLDASAWSHSTPTNATGQQWYLGEEDSGYFTSWTVQVAGVRNSVISDADAAEVYEWLNS